METKTKNELINNKLSKMGIKLCYTYVSGAASKFTLNLLDATQKRIIRLIDKPQLN